ncbi:MULTISPECIES: hypothetical protein [unclassified Micromonospora]
MRRCGATPTNNDLAGNADGPTRLDTPPVGGRWDRNHGDQDW